MTISTHPVPRRSMSLIEAGDTYVFNGLRGETVVTPEDDTDRLITILGISVSGDVSFSIAWIPVIRGDRPHIDSVPYLAALRLIEDRIWQACESPK